MKTLTWLRKRNIKRKAEFLLISLQNNSIRNNYIKPRIDKVQQNSKCGYRDEMINHIISKCKKVEQREYKSEQVRVVIHLELCKKSNFDHANKWYVHIPESVQEREAQNSLGFWYTKPTLCVTTRLSDTQQKNRKLAVPANYRVQLKEGKREISTWTKLENWKKNKKTCNKKVTGISIVIGALGTVTKG